MDGGIYFVRNGQYAPEKLLRRSGALLNLYALSVLLLSPAALAADMEIQGHIVLHGNVKSFKYHNPGCKYYSCRNCVKKFKTGAEAREAGYIASLLCYGDRGLTKNEQEEQHPPKAIKKRFRKRR